MSLYQACGGSSPQQKITRKIPSDRLTPLAPTSSLKTIFVLSAFSSGFFVSCPTGGLNNWCFKPKISQEDSTERPLHSHVYSNNGYPLKFNSSPLKNDGWKNTFLLGRYLFEGRTVKLREGNKWFILVVYYFQPMLGGSSHVF